MASVPPSVPVDGQLRVWWVPALASTAAPSVTEVTAGVDVTCYFVETKAGVSKDQSTIADRRMCNTTALQIPGAGTATADDITYIYDPQAPSSDPMNVAFDELQEESVGHYVVRRGVTYDTVATAAQQVEVQSCTNGVRWDSSNPTEDFSKMTQRRFLTGFVEKAALVA